LWKVSIIRQAKFNDLLSSKTGDISQFIEHISDYQNDREFDSFVSNFLCEFAIDGRMEL
jgi:hypothetical protein